MSADSTDHSAWAESKLYMMNADGSNPHLVSGTLDRPISGLVWARGRQQLVLQRRERRVEEPLRRRTARGQFRPVTSGKQVLTVVERRRRTDWASASAPRPTKPNDVVSFAVPKTGTTSTFTQLTAVNDDVLAGKELAQTEEIWYTSKDGLEDPGLDREAARLRPGEEVSAHPRHPRRPAVDVQRRIQLRAPGSRGERLRHSLHQSARQHGLRREVHERDQERVSGQGLRRPDGRRRHGARPRLHRSEEHVRLRLLGRRRAHGVDRWPHDALRRGGGALPGDRLDQLRRRDGRGELVSRTSRSRSGRIRASICAARRSCTWATSRRRRC